MDAADLILGSSEGIITVDMQPLPPTAPVGTSYEGGFAYYCAVMMEVYI